MKKKKSTLSSWSRDYFGARLIIREDIARLKKALLNNLPQQQTGQFLRKHMQK